MWRNEGNMKMKNVISRFYLEARSCYATLVILDNSFRGEREIKGGIHSDANDFWIVLFVKERGAIC